MYLLIWQRKKRKTKNFQWLIYCIIVKEEQKMEAKCDASLQTYMFTRSKKKFSENFLLDKTTLNDINNQCWPIGFLLSSSVVNKNYFLLR